MALHLIKLCVGAESIADLEGWIAERRRLAERAGGAFEQFHTTRMVPKRVAGFGRTGSLYWVIKGMVAARQPLLEVRPFTDAEGISRCHLVLEPTVVPVRPRPCRPFQGWRYMPAEDAPADLGTVEAEVEHLPEKMRKDLRELGLI
ncbi:MAG: DUF1489 domain-containing protein [Rhodoblastus sp.]|nr:MAG: DUF1489 domain-containing protein [Rhodoblastus sp.]